MCSIMWASLQAEVSWVIVPITLAGVEAVAVGEALCRARGADASFVSEKATTATKSAAEKGAEITRQLTRVRSFGPGLETTTQLVTTRFRFTSGRNRLKRTPKFSLLSTQRNRFQASLVETEAASWLLKTI